MSFYVRISSFLRVVPWRYSLRSLHLYFLVSHIHFLYRLPIFLMLFCTFSLTALSHVYRKFLPICLLHFFVWLFLIFHTLQIFLCFISINLFHTFSNISIWFINKGPLMIIFWIFQVIDSIKTKLILRRMMPFLCSYNYLKDAFRITFRMKTFYYVTTYWFMFRQWIRFHFHFISLNWKFNERRSLTNYKFSVIILTTFH